MKEFYYLKPWQYVSSVILFIVFASIISWFIYSHVYPGIAVVNSELKLPVINLSSVISGKIKHIHVQGGANIRQGQVLIELSDGKIQAEITKAKDRLALLEKQQSDQQSNCQPNVTKRARDVALDRLGCQLTAELERVNQGAISHLQQQIDILNQQLKHTLIKAPTSGKILQIKVKKNKIITPDTILLDILNVTDAEMIVFIKKEQANLAKLNSEVRVTLFKLDNIVIPASITFISPSSKQDPLVIEGSSSFSDLEYPIRLKIKGDYLANYLDYIEPVMQGKVYIKLNPKANWPKALHRTVVIK